MKKRAVVFVLATVLSLSIVGCGNSAEPKQEESAEVEQEETKEADQDVTTQEFSNNDIVIKVEDTTSKYILREFEYEEADGTITPDTDVPIYCEDGYQIGYINAGATIEITEHGLNSAWYRFPNPINGTSYDYIFVGSMDIDMSNIYCESYAGTYVSEEEPVISEEETVDPYDEILKTVGFDKNKEYTRDEYIEILTKVCEEMGKTYNKEMEIMNPFDDYDGFHLEGMLGITEYTEETVKKIMNRVEYGKDGWGGITEFCITKAEKDGVEGINMVVKVDHEEHQKNIDAGSY